MFIKQSWVLFIILIFVIGLNPAIYGVNNNDNEGSDNRKACNPGKISGTYFRVEDINSDGGNWDLITLGADGTALVQAPFQIIKMEDLGTALPAQGAWKCVGKGKILVQLYAPATRGSPEPIGNKDLTFNFRLTFLLNFAKDHQTFVREEAVIKLLGVSASDLANAQDPDAAGPAFSLDNFPPKFEKVVPFDSDIP